MSVDDPAVLGHLEPLPRVAGDEGPVADVVASGEELDPARPDHPVRQQVVVVAADRRLVGPLVQAGLGAVLLDPSATQHGGRDAVEAGCLVQAHERVGLAPVAARPPAAVDQGHPDVGVVDQGVGVRHAHRPGPDNQVVGLDSMCHGATQARAPAGRPRAMSTGYGPTTYSSGSETRHDAPAQARTRKSWLRMTASRSVVRRVCGLVGPVGPAQVVVLDEVLVGVRVRFEVVELLEPVGTVEVEVPGGADAEEEPRVGAPGSSGSRGTPDSSVLRTVDPGPVLTSTGRVHPRSPSSATGSMPAPSTESGISAPPSA